LPDKMVGRLVGIPSAGFLSLQFNQQRVIDEEALDRGKLEAPSVWT
jgi:hypothetical protein